MGLFVLPLRITGMASCSYTAFSKEQVIEGIYMPDYY